IATLFGSGVNSIIIAGTLGEAYSLKKAFPEKLLCGEKGGLRPDGFDYGNSPLEFSTIDLSGRQAILKTTNGTISFLKAAESPAVFSLAALNFRHTMDDILDYALENAKDILLLCSGEMGKIAYDDAYIAGLAVKYLLSKPRDFIYSDSSKLVLSAVLADRVLSNALSKSISALSLKKVGTGEDIGFCSKLNNYNLTIKAKTLSTPQAGMTAHKKSIIELMLYKR
ncbi:MAG: 2-phosphosulfolactate phosphatase, partial [Actinobacteria bacterium]|nr:2-phosphosulfolactate phosphatase [Actinomycetota bacterium]